MGTGGRRSTSSRSVASGDKGPYLCACVCVCICVFVFCATAYDEQTQVDCGHGERTSSRSVCSPDKRPYLDNTDPAQLHYSSMQEME